MCDLPQTLETLEKEATELSVMVTEAKRIIVNLFSENNRQLWSVYPSEKSIKTTPTSSASASSRPTPPPSPQTYEVVPVTGLTDDTGTFLASIMDSLGKSTQQWFDGNMHNDSFWTTFFHTLMIELSGGLMECVGHVQTEAEVRYQLITPLLKRIAHSVPMIHNPEGYVDLQDGASYSSLLGYEQITEERLYMHPRIQAGY